MRRLAIVLVLLAALPTTASRRRSTGGATAWTARLTASSPVATTIANRTIESSTRLLGTWSAPATAIDHYRITAIETGGGVPRAFTAARTATSAELTGLESGTEYRIELRACADAACGSSIAADATATGTTSAEYWQIRGTGNSYATATKLVSDGNTKPFAVRYDAEAGAALAGTVQLYYDPNVGNEKGIKLATSSDPLGTFTGVSGFGFLRSDAAGRMGTGPATFQVVPLSARLGAKMRIFWEASGTDGRGRIYSRDSVDGWTGRDFHSGAPTICQEQDVASGGACAATLLVGAEGDASLAHPKIRQARQLKVGVPLLDSWTWDATPGTFMVLTAHLTDTSCSATFFNAAFAIWDGARWNVQSSANGCPKLIPGVQAPMPVHLGGARYKLYFNDNQSGAGPLTAFKPLEVLYADGAATGDPSLVEFEDWETADRVREIHVLWPSGAELTDAEESHFDDFQAWMPTRDPSLQVIYSNMSCPNNACGAPFIGTAVLVNP